MGCVFLAAVVAILNVAAIVITSIVRMKTIMKMENHLSRRSFSDGCLYFYVARMLRIHLTKK
jgi:hypothetical protein